MFLLDGVLLAKKDFNAAKHAELDVPNLQVIKACISLKSRGYVTEKFSWQYYYFFLTDEGIEYLRGQLGLAADAVPATHKGTSAPVHYNRQGDGERRREPRGERAGEGDYRRSKNTGADGSFNPSFRGAGRGARAE